MVKLTKNGSENPEAIACEARARIYQVTPDGSQWEVRVHLESDVGQGKEIIAEAVFRSYNGGVAPLMGLATEAPKAAAACINQVLAILQKQQSRVQVVNGLPPDLKRGN